MKHRDNFYRGFIWAHGSTTDMVGGTERQAQKLEGQAKSSCLEPQQKAERANWEWHGAFETSKPPLLTCFLQQGYPSEISATSWGLCSFPWAHEKQSHATTTSLYRFQKRHEEDEGMWQILPSPTKATEQSVRLICSNVTEVTVTSEKWGTLRCKCNQCAFITYPFIWFLTYTYTHLPVFPLIIQDSLTHKNRLKHKRTFRGNKTLTAGA